MKRIVKLIAVFCLILPMVANLESHLPTTAVAQGQVDFYMDTPIAGDDQIEGMAVANQPITLLVDGVTYDTEVGEDGRFSFDLDIPLEEDLEILLTQGQNQLDTQVFAEEEGPERITLDQPINLAGLVEAESQPEDDSSSDDQAEDNLDAEESAPEAAESEDDQVEGQQEDGEDSEASEDQADAGENESSESLEEDESEEMTITPFSAFGPQNVTASAAPGPSSPNVGVAEVSTIQELRNAMNDSRIEVVVLTQDIIVSSNGGTTTVDSDTGQKILDGNGYSLEINRSAGFDTIRNINHMVIRNFSNIFTQNLNYGFLRMRTNAYNLHLENITFNRDQISSGNHLGSAWESTIHFYGDIDIYIPPARAFASQYRLYRVHDGANVRINSGTTGLDSRNTGGVAGLDRGLIVGNNAQVTIEAVNHALDSNFNGNGNLNLSVGDYSNVRLVSRNGNGFDASGNSNVVVNVGYGSALTIDTPNTGIAATNNYTNHQVDINVLGDLTINANRGLHFRQQNFTHDIGEGGRVNIEAVDHAYYQENGISSNNPEFTVGPGAQWNVSSNQPVFRLMIQSYFNINEPELVDFTTASSNPNLISTDANHQFTIKNLQMRSWHTNPNLEEADVITETFNSGTFTLTGNGFQNVSANPASDIFPADFNRTMRRWRFLSALEPPVIDGPILDTMMQIEGTGPANSTIEVRDSSGEVITTTEADSNGNFVFVFDEAFEVDTELSFRARSGNRNSEYVQEIVVGNRLELRQVPDITFETTAIRDEPDLIIPKTNPVTAIVYDTREAGGWQLTVRAGRPLTNTAGHTLEDTLFYANDPSHTNLQTLEQTPVLVASDQESSADGGGYIQEVNWAADQGFVMQLNPIYSQTGSMYSTSLEWTLTDAP